MVEASRTAIKIERPYPTENIFVKNILLHFKNTPYIFHVSSPLFREVIGYIFRFKKVFAYINLFFSRKDSYHDA